MNDKISFCKTFRISLLTACDRKIVAAKKHSQKTAKTNVAAKNTHRKQQKNVAAVHFPLSTNLRFTFVQTTSNQKQIKETCLLDIHLNMFINAI